MSSPSDNSNTLTSRFRDALPSILKASRHTEIWGLDIEHSERQVLDAALNKVSLQSTNTLRNTLLNHQQFLESHSGIPALQVSRASASLEKSLKWRSYSFPRALLTEAESILPDLDLCHITLSEGQYVLWINIDEMAIKGHSAIHPSLTTSQRLVKLGLAVMEKLATLLLHATVPDTGPHEYSASCVVEFKIYATPNTDKEQQSYQKRICDALEELVTLIRLHYPGILGKAYIINSCVKYLAYLDIEEALLKNTVLLEHPEDLAHYLGSQVPSRYGGTGKSFVESDLLRYDRPTENPEDSSSFQTPEIGAITEIETTTASPTTTSCNSTEDVEVKGEQQIRLIYSETIGPPTIILDPDDLQTAEHLCPGKMGARVVFADSDMVVKFGHGVRLAEAEALHLASTRTTIAVPRLLSAYILDGVGYIIMSYEAGESLEQYWDRTSLAEHNRVLDSLQDYVKQMREITGDFIGALDRSSCRDGIFEAGYGDYTRYSYGPYPSEESFNEGIIQALRDRLAPKVLERKDDFESTFFNSEYTLYQTVRGLQNHKIVFTHGDLHPGNILVRADGTVVLLDWGLAGFWPEYWEFYRAMNNIPWRASWDRMVEKFIPPFYVEFSVMKLLVIVCILIATISRQ